MGIIDVIGGGEIQLAAPSRGLRAIDLPNKILGGISYLVDPIYYSWSEIEAMKRWCYETFGFPGTDVDTMSYVWNYHSDPDTSFWFSDEANRTLFLLRWSGE